MNTKALRQKILDLAIHGKLVPQDPNDEPASMLLDRIRAEKERLIKEGKIKKPKKTKATCDKPHYQKECPFAIPDSWQWTTVEDIAESNIGLTYKPSDIRDNGIPVYRSNNIQNGRIDKAELVRVDTKILDKQYLAIGDLLICARNGSRRLVGKCALIQELSEPSSFGAFMAVCRSAYNPWIYLLLNTSYFDRYLDDSNSTTINQVTQSMLLSFRVPFPPNKEQDRIIKEVNKWFKLIETIEQRREELKTVISTTKSKILDLAIHGKLVPQDLNDESASELLKRINPKAETVCDNPHYGNLPKGWCLIQGKYLYKPMKSTKPQGSFFNYIDIDSIDNAKQNIDSVKVVKTENAPSRASRYTQKGDIVFSMVRPYLKNIAIVPDNDCIASTGFYVCSPSNVEISKYCYYVMISDYTVSGLNQFMKGDNSPSINKSDIDNWLFPLPPLSEQRRIVTKIEELFAQLDKIEASL